MNSEYIEVTPIIKVIVGSEPERKDIVTINGNEYEVSGYAGKSTLDGSMMYTVVNLGTIDSLVVGKFTIAKCSDMVLTKKYIDNIRDFELAIIEELPKDVAFVELNEKANYLLREYAEERNLTLSGAVIYLTTYRE